MHITLLTRQIGHYHDARYRGAVEMFDRVTVIVTAGEGFFSEFAARELGAYTCIHLNASQADYEAALRDRRLGAEVEAALQNAAPDIVAVAGWASAESAAALLWARRHDVPVVMMSESQIDDASRSTLREWAKGRIVRLADAAFVGGPPQAAYAARLGMPKDRIALGYNVVGNAHFEARSDAVRADPTSRARYGLPGSYLLASARFINKKNLSALITAHGAVHRTGGPELVILGDGEERAAVETARTAHPTPSRVHLLGFRSYDDLPTFYGLAEGFAHVSTVEQWGLVINEAMAASLPVIASDRCGATRSVIEDGVSGIATTPDPPALETALARLEALGPEGRAQMGAAARKAISAWGPDRFGTGLRAAAETALSVPRRGPMSLVDQRLLVHLSRSRLTAVS